MLSMASPPELAAGTADKLARLMAKLGLCHGGARETEYRKLLQSFELLCSASGGANAASMLSGAASLRTPTGTPVARMNLTEAPFVDDAVQRGYSPAVAAKLFYSFDFTKGKRGALSGDEVKVKPASAARTSTPIAPCSPLLLAAPFFARSAH